MKRTAPWKDDVSSDDTSSDDTSSSSTLDTDTEENEDSSTDKGSSAASQEPAKRKNKGINFEALSRHGYKGGLSVLKVPPPKEDEQKDWSWSTGKDTRGKEADEESYADRQKTRAAIAEGEQMANLRPQKDKKNLSFSQKEKRKRDLGQASRGKNYVEEEKRTLRDSGIYSGFDS